jgi:hypothetical protein
MISERQQDANRRNAAKSNGPKTPELERCNLSFYDRRTNLLHSIRV